MKTFWWLNAMNVNILKVKCNECKHFNGWMQWMYTFWWLNAMDVIILMVICNECKHCDG